MPKKKLVKKTKNTVSKKKASSSFTSSNPLVIIGIGLITLLAIANIQTTHLLNVNEQKVLGDDEKSEDEKKAEEIQKENAKQDEERQKQLEEKQREATKITPSRSLESSENKSRLKTETLTPSGIKMKTQTENNKQETEIETADGQKIKTKIEDDGTAKVEVENGTVKLKYRVENGQVMLVAENEEGKEIELEDDELEELETSVEDDLKEDNIELEPTADNKIAVIKNKVAALTVFPLSIDVVTKQLIVTTPSGQKIVTVLPDVAVQNLLATGIITKVDTTSVDTETQDQLGTSTEVVKLEIKNNRVVYKVSGKKTHKMLGLIPVTTPVTAYVSTDTGETISKQQSVLTNVVDFLSP